MAVGVLLRHRLGGNGGGFEHAGKINDKPSHRREYDLRGDKGKELSGACGVREKNRNCLVAGGKENGNEGSGGDYPAGVKVCRNDGKASLGNHPEKGADEGAGFSEFREPMGELVRRPVLNELDEQIGGKEKGKTYERVLQRVYQKMQDFLDHLYTSYYI